MLKKNLFYNFLLSISALIFPLITFPYSSRILGPVGIGSVNFIDSVTAYFIMFSTLGIPAYGIREAAKRRNDKKALNKFCSEMLLFHITSTSIFTVVYLITAMLLPNLRNHLDLVFIGIGILFLNVISVEWFFIGMEKFQYITIRSLIARITGVVFLFVFLKKGSSPAAYYLIGASGPAINSLYNFTVFNKYSKIGFTGLSVKKHFKPLAAIFGSSLATSVYVLMDNIMLGFIKGDAEVGLYSTAVRIVKVPFAMIGAVSSVIIPQISFAFTHGNREQIKILLNKSYSYISVTGIPIAFGLFVASSFLVHTFAGEKFAGAVIALQILSPVIILVGLNNLFAIQMLGTMNKENFLLRSVVAGMIFSIIVNILLIPLLSYIGAAITNLLTELVVTVAAYYYVNKYLDINITLNKKLFFQCLAGAAAFFPISYLLRSLGLNFILTEILVIGCCAAFYVSYVWFFVKNIYIDNIKVIILKRLRLKSFQHEI